MFMKRVGVLLGLYAMCALHSPTSTIAGGHGGDPHEGEHMGPPPPPPAVAEEIEDVLAEGELSETAEAMLEFLLLTPAEREEAGEPDFDEEDLEYAEEEIEQLFNDLLDEDIDDTANGYLHMMISNMNAPPPHDGEDHMPPPHDGEDHMPPPHDGEDHMPPPHDGEDHMPPPHDGEDHMPPPHDGEAHMPPPHDGEHMPPPSPPPALAEFIEDIIDEGELTDTASEMLEFLLMTPEERQEAGEPDFDEEDLEYAEEEIEQLFNDLLDEDIDDTANGYLNMMLEEMNREHHDGDGQHHDGGE